MKTVAFHSNQLGIRGTEVALYDYAHYNETILGNKSIIVSDKNNDLQALNKFISRFKVFLYEDFKECIDFTQKENIESIYFQKAGDFDGKIVPGIKNYVHAVFQERDIHGDSYCYISKWLAKKMDLEDQYVPYIVDLPQPTKNFRQKLNITNDQIVVGRHGGFNEFDLPFVYPSIYKVLETRSDIVFVFMNTRPFGPPHKNIIYVEGTYNMQHKSNYINTCDYMLHGRHRGETFGLAVSEFLFHDKPIISWKNGLDQNHIELLGEKGLWYKDSSSLIDLLLQITKPNCEFGYYSNLVKEFSPQEVMKRFDKMFLQK